MEGSVGRRGREGKADVIEGEVGGLSARVVGVGVYVKLVTGWRCKRGGLGGGFRCRSRTLQVVGSKVRRVPLWLGSATMHQPLRHSR